MRLTEKTGPIAAARVINSDDNDLMIISAGGTVIRQGVQNIAQAGRPTQGVRLMNMASGDEVVAIATTNGKDTGDEDEGGEGSQDGVAEADGLWSGAAGSLSDDALE
jgi:DNA gyrase subunit A